MRKAAEKAGVSWNHHSIIYKKGGISYQNTGSDDANQIKDELEKLLGYRPVEIDEPTTDTNTDDRQ
jgi:hypothetical protein